MAAKKDYPILPGFKNTPSGVQLLYRSCNRRIWSLGSNVIMKESPYDSPAETPWDEDAILEFLHDNTTIPVPNILAEWIDDNDIHFVIKDKIAGESLDSLWPTMPWEQKEKIADQTADYLRQLRSLTAPSMSRVSDQPLVDMMLFNTTYPEPKGPFNTQDELWTAMAATLKGQIPQKALDRLRLQMPECAPFTYTHGDLSMGNIIIQDGNVVGIIDWEWSCYAPVWWEYAKFRAGMPRWIDADWWELLEDRMDKYPEAIEFYDKFRSLIRKVESTDGRKIRMGCAVLNELLEDDNGVPLV
ncbi:kinase-like domain-containing protein [Trichophaea hybrida]|nr:kinase-like domain-containing protein [Trichophaea hybrida]